MGGPHDYHHPPQMSAAPPKIRIEHLIKIYGSRPQAAIQLFRDGRTREKILETTGNVLGVADVSLEIQTGELFVIMGLSGSGKSTLVRCLNRLIAPTSGHIFVDDEDVAHVSPERMREIRRTKMAMVFQRFGLFPHKSVVQNVAYGLKVRGMAESERRRKALDVLDVVGLAQWADHPPAALSGGMQQRVGLARALATDADILLMDEAFSALDPLIRRGMQEELLRLQADLRKTIVFISHDIQEALKIGDRVAVMKDGALVQVGTPEDLVLQPVDDYIRAFTQGINRGQVLTAGTIAHSTPTIRLAQDSTQTAWEQMQHHNLSVMYVLDPSASPVGVVLATDLEAAIKAGEDEIAPVLRREFSQVKTTTPLEALLPLCQSNIPIAIVNSASEFQGSVMPSEVLVSIGG